MIGSDSAQIRTFIDALREALGLGPLYCEENAQWTKGHEDRFIRAGLRHLTDGGRQVRAQWPTT